jgi:hypothetical protein
MVNNLRRIFFPLAQQPFKCQGLLTIEASRSHSQTTLDRTPQEEWSARRRALYLTTHNTHNSQTSMPPPAFELTIPANERPQTHALDRVATETGDFKGRQVDCMYIILSCLLLNKLHLFSLTQHKDNQFKLPSRVCYMFRPVFRPSSGMSTHEHIREDAIKI